MMEENINNSDLVNNEGGLENNTLNNTRSENDNKNTTTCCSNRCDKIYKIMNILTFVGVIVLFILGIMALAWYAYEKGSRIEFINAPASVGLTVASSSNPDTTVNSYQKLPGWQDSIKNSDTTKNTSNSSTATSSLSFGLTKYNLLFSVSKKALSQSPFFGPAAIRGSKPCIFLIAEPIILDVSAYFP